MMRLLPGWFTVAVPRGKRSKEAPRVPAVKSKARAAISRAVVETVEGRLYLTTLYAYMDAQPSGTFGSPYVVNLYTSGGQASKWVVSWKDGTTAQTFTTAGTFGTAYAVTHTYATGSPPTAAITATATLSGSSTTATASFALYNSYGTYQFQYSGRDSFTVNGDTIGQSFTAVDPDNSDAEFVAFDYNPGSGSHDVIAIAKFSSQGIIDNNWGDNAHGTGGSGIFFFQTSDGGDDHVLGIAAGDGYIAVVGQCPSGSLVEVINEGSDPYGKLGYEVTGLPLEGTFGGAATSVIYDGGLFYVAGSDSTGTKLAAAEIDDTQAVGWSATPVAPSYLDQGVVVTSITQASSDVYVGGYTNYCANGSGCGTGGSSDFTIAAFNSGNGALDTGFGSSGVSRYNVTGGYCTCCTSASIDTLYSLVTWEDSGTPVITAVGGTTSGAGCDVYTALETYRADTGALVSGYGTGGVAESCNPFTPSAAMVYTSSGSTNGEIIVTGGSADFKTIVFDTSGTPTSGSFGNGGNLVIDFGGTTTNTNDQCYSIIELSDGSVLLAGTSSGNIALADCLLSVAPDIT